MPRPSAIAPGQARSTRGFTLSLRSAQQGFTLLEMLVALSVLSLAALALVRLDGFTVRSTGDLSQRTMAAIVADNAVTALSTSPDAPALGQTQSSITNGGIAWLVTIRVSALPDPALRRIDIRASAPDGTSATASGVRSVP